MKLLLLYLLMPVLFLLSGCSKFGGEKKTRMSMEGTIRDQFSGSPVSGVSISVRAVKPSGGGVGLNLGGKSEMVGRAVTDASGYYKLKMNVFESAERLDLDATYPVARTGYCNFSGALQLSTLDRTGSNTRDFLMTPTATLQIRFKNVNMAAATDTFRFDYSNFRFPVTHHVLDTSICGTVHSRYGYWYGQDVCGQTSIVATADQKCYVFWNVRKGGTQRDYRDSILVPRGSTTTVYNINY